jgi:glycerol dehydrogenase-like iron-containing ADH family enzyme
MDKAKSVKAEVSVKARYDAAFSVYTEAESLAAAGSADGIGKYLEAETAFLAAHDEAKAKREEAQLQLSRARDAIKTVENDAANFDREQSEDNQKGVSP